MVVLPIIGCALTAIGVVAMQSSSSAATECSPFEGQITESKRFTPYAERRGHVLVTTINPYGTSTPDIPEDLSVPSINGVPRQWAIVGPDGAVYQYYLNRAIDKDMTLAEFHQAGGIQLDADPEGGNGNFAAYLKEELGDRVVSVPVRDTVAALVWADAEDESEMRLHNVYWDHNDFTFGLYLDQSPEEAVTSARRVACELK